MSKAISLHRLRLHWLNTTHLFLHQPVIHITVVEGNVHSHFLFAGNSDNIGTDLGGNLTYVAELSQLQTYSPLCSVDVVNQASLVPVPTQVCSGIRARPGGL